VSALAEIPAELIGCMIVAVTTWIATISTQSSPSASSTRAQMGVASALYAFFVVWCLTIQRFPWPFRRSKAPELLVGGFREFPILFGVLLLFMAVMAVFCCRRAFGRQAVKPGKAE